MGSSGLTHKPCHFLPHIGLAEWLLHFMLLPESKSLHNIDSPAHSSKINGRKVKTVKISLIAYHHFLAMPSFQRSELKVNTYYSVTDLNQSHYYHASYTLNSHLNIVIKINIIIPIMVIKYK